MKDLELMADDQEELKQAMDEENEKALLRSQIWQLRKDHGLDMEDTTDWTIEDLNEELAELTPWLDDVQNSMPDLSGYDLEPDEDSWSEFSPADVAESFRVVGLGDA